MTEELEKEAEEYARNQWEGNLPWSVIQKAYYDGALPREKRIADLEAQIEKMKCCENCRHRELIREHGQWKERFNCKGNRCVCHSKWEIKGNA